MSGHNYVNTRIIMPPCVSAGVGARVYVFVCVWPCVFECVYINGQK